MINVQSMSIPGLYYPIYYHSLYNFYMIFLICDGFTTDGVLNKYMEMYSSASFDCTKMAQVTHENIKGIFLNLVCIKFINVI